MHYSRWKAHGTPDGPARRIQSAACISGGCAEKPVARDLCKRHYYAAKRVEERAQRPTPPTPPPCAVEGCEGRVKARGWCDAHYQRWRRFGDPTFAPTIRRKRCTIDGCDRVTNARGLCQRHYYRWHRYGDPLTSPNQPRTSEPVRAYPPRQCVTCGEDFDPGPSAARRYCNRRCRPSRASAGVNNRATVVRLAAIHGWFCYLCLEPIDPQLFWPNLEAGSVDHVVAVKNGGKDDVSNLGLAHLAHNLAKGIL